MKRTITTLLILLGLTVAGQTNFKVVGYIGNWNNLTTFSNNFDFTKVTHICIAFKNPNSAGNLSSITSGESYLISKAHENGVKVFISIGGGSISSNSTYINRYDDLMSPSKLTDFVSKLTRYTVNNNLDGIDVDLEGDAIDPDLYPVFIEELHDSLKAQNKLITSALSQGYGGNNVSTYTFAFFDWINIMAYDATGPWSSEGHHSTYTFAVNNLNYWKNRGLPKSKCVLGLPFYGYGFGSAYSSSGYSYNYLVNNYAGAENEDTIGNSIYYNGQPTIEAKTQLAINQGGGVMIWELSQDATGDKSLLGTIYSTLVLSTNKPTIAEEKISIYPNPSSDQLNLQIDLQSYEVKIVSVTGSTLFEGSNTKTISVENMPKGIYLLEIVSEEGRAIRKISVR